MDLTSWENRLINHTINKNKAKEIAKLKKVFQSRTKWLLMKKNQRVLLVCWKLTINGMFEINKKQISEICDCNEKYVNHLFQNSPCLKTEKEKNLIFSNFETIIKKRPKEEFFIALGKKFFINRKPNFNHLSVLSELKEYLTKQEKNILNKAIEAVNKKTFS